MKTRSQNTSARFPLFSGAATKPQKKAIASNITKHFLTNVLKQLPLYLEWITEVGVGLSNKPSCNSLNTGLKFELFCSSLEAQMFVVWSCGTLLDFCCGELWHLIRLLLCGVVAPYQTFVVWSCGTLLSTRPTTVCEN